MEVVAALIRAEKITMKAKRATDPSVGVNGNMNGDVNGKGNQSVPITLPLNGSNEGITTSCGFTALHFSCYFGASQKVIDMLLS